MNHFYLLPLIESLIRAPKKLTDINTRLAHFRSNKNFLLYLPPTPPKLRHRGWCILQAAQCELHSLKLCRGFRCETAKQPCLLTVAGLCSMPFCVTWTISPSHHPRIDFRLGSLLTTNAKMSFSFSELPYFHMLLLHCVHLPAFLLPTRLTLFCLLAFLLVHDPL